MANVLHPNVDNIPDNIISSSSSIIRDLIHSASHAFFETDYKLLLRTCNTMSSTKYDDLDTVSSTLDILNGLAKIAASQCLATPLLHLLRLYDHVNTSVYTPSKIRNETTGSRLLPHHFFIIFSQWSFIHHPGGFSMVVTPWRLSLRRHFPLRTALRSSRTLSVLSTTAYSLFLHSTRAEESITCSARLGRPCLVSCLLLIRNSCTDASDGFPVLSRLSKTLHSPSPFHMHSSTLCF